MQSIARLTTNHSSLLTAFFLLVICHWSLVTVLPAQGIITTVAGNGRVFRGEGGPAIRAQMGLVYGVAVDPAGNVYAADQTNNVVVKISPDGIIRIVAGNNISGFSGDGGPATSASLTINLGGVATDGAGDLFIADQLNNRVRKVTPDGVINTIAGNGRAGFSGDGGPATSTSLASPAGLALDGAGNLYIADAFNNRIRMVSPSGIITTVAGNGAAGFSGDGGRAVAASLNEPRGVAVDAAGNLFIADRVNNRVRKVVPEGIISTVAGNGVPDFLGDGGSALSASLRSPFGVAVDASGNLYIADASNVRIRKVSAAGIISTAAVSGYPTAVAVDSTGILYIADPFNGRVRRVDPEGTITTLAGIGLANFSGDGRPATAASLSEPRGVVPDRSGNFYIADSRNNRIRKVSSDGTITTVAGNGVAAFSGDGGLAINSSL